MVEDAAGVRLIDNEDVPEKSQNGAFENWSYTTEINDGSYQIIHTGYNNAFNRPPFVAAEDNE